MDFEEGTATVEVLLTPEESKDQSLTNKKLEEAVKTLLTTEVSTKDYATESEKPESLETAPVLKGQLQTTGGVPVNSSNAAAYAKEIVKPENIKSETIKGEDGKERTKITVTMERLLRV